MIKDGVVTLYTYNELNQITKAGDINYTWDNTRMTILATGLEVVASVLLIWHGWRNYSGAKSTAKAAGAVDNANKGNNTVYYVTPDGIVVKNRIPDNYIDNPYRSGSYGILDENGKFVEKLRIDPATSPGKKGPDYSHYHVDGGKEHFSSRPGDNNPLGF